MSHRPFRYLFTALVQVCFSTNHAFVSLRNVYAWPKCFPAGDFPYVLVFYPFILTIEFDVDSIEINQSATKHVSQRMTS